MIITILAIILALGMGVGGLIPNLANGAIHSQLDSALNHPKHLSVEVHPHAPSFGMLNAEAAFADIDAKDFVVSDLPIQSLHVHMANLSADTSGKKIKLRKPAQAAVRIKVSEQGLNQFLQSNTFKKLWERAKKSGRIPIDADLVDLKVALKSDRLMVSGKAETMGGFFTVPFQVAGTLRLVTERQLFVFDPEAKTLERPVSKDILKAILNQLNPLLDVKKWSGEKMDLFFREVTVKEGHLEFLGEATFNQLP